VDTYLGLLRKTNLNSSFDMDYTALLLRTKSMAGIIF
jgi:hypothetical protein